MTGADAASMQDPSPDDRALPLTDASNRGFWIGLVVVLFSLVSGLATYLILTGLTTIVPGKEVVLGVFLVNVVVIVAMFAVIAWLARGLWRAWRHKVAGAHLHLRIVALFSLITALPVILLAMAATVTFSRSLDGLLTSTRQIVENSLDVANAYLEEHGQVIRTDIVNMAKDLDDAANLITQDPDQFRTLLLGHAAMRELPVAYVIDAAGRPLVNATEDPSTPYIAPPKETIAQAEAGQVPLLLPANSHRVAAVVKLQAHPGRYLYVARGVNPRVMGQLGRTQAVVTDQEKLRERSGGLKAVHGLMYTMITLTTLFAALWLGLWQAGRFVAPIRRLIAAAQKVSKGDLRVELPVYRGEGDLRRLSQTFNTMTAELKSQRDALVTANEQLTERRSFMEAVLSNVSAGVLGLDGEGRITIANRSAEKLLGVPEGGLAGKPLLQAVPEFNSLPAAADTLHGDSHVQVTRVVGGEIRTFAVTVTRERPGEQDGNAVVTFDDITELVSAQRSSAWADVARRIAHEIKNPLTPIQLSAERIRRKYGNVIKEDRDVFDKCTETIIRQVGDVARMVDEFSAFARMPKPQMETSDLREVAREAITLFQMSISDITFELHLPHEPVPVLIDRRLMSQALTNLVKNAAEAIHQAAEKAGKASGYKGRVDLCVTRTGERAVIDVVDNGIGLAKQNRALLLEPYVTTKTKGTGLGLAIVQKIVEQHRGTIALEDAPPGPERSKGALVRITLPVRTSETEAALLKLAAE